MPDRQRGAQRVVVAMTGSGWYRDPTRVHQWRYYNGTIWTDQVADQGIQSTDTAPPTAHPKQHRSDTIGGWIIAGIGILIAAAALIQTFFGQNRPEGTLARQQRAVCEDLDNGHSMNQIATAGLDGGMTYRDVASAMMRGIQDHCDQYLDEFKKTMIYTDWL